MIDVAESIVLVLGGLGGCIIVAMFLISVVGLTYGVAGVLVAIRDTHKESLMAVHFNLKFDLTEYEDDGDDERCVRRVSIESHGPGPWTNLQLHGRGLTAEETAAIQKIHDAMRELSEIHR